MVCIASSLVGAEPSDNCKRWDSDLRKYVGVFHPLCIAEYNKFMGGVVLGGMLIELYRINIHGKKWHIRLFLLFLGSFSRQRMVALSASYGPKLVKPKPYDSVRYDGIQPWPEAVADKKRCRLCSACARIQCSKCQVSLCLVQNRNCFKIFRTQ
ncbi:hypothetical protein QYM36_012507 [Artemia franciscana]|uniref:PiggyBac transposable element-derived protein domain-containing protein n=1 Tax=Artemia franciscana TaxID=6661 RepID=A0AA88L7W7_ARTSF|nr:hypothetical protein QYM36_012507 [Artemia franciscana]